MPTSRLILLTGSHSTPAPARGGQTLADKLQRLVLEQPRIAWQIEQLLDVFLAPAGGAK